MPGMQGTGEGSGTWPLGRGWDIRLGLHTDRRAKAGKGPREGRLGSQSLDLRQQARQKGIPGEKNPGHVNGRVDHRSGLLHGEDFNRRTNLPVAMP